MSIPRRVGRCRPSGSSAWSKSGDRSLMVHRTRGRGDQPVAPPAPSTIDLHTHTNRSDGVQSPAALVESAAAVGVTTLAITDHDTLAGYPSVREVAPRPR